LVFSLCPPWPWDFFPLEKQGEKTWGDGSVCEWICRTLGGYFISCESALGVMTGWRTLMGIPNIRVFFPNAKGFSLNSVHGSRMRIFCGFYTKGQEFVRFRLG
jgi:hypothetical protein